MYHQLLLNKQTHSYEHQIYVGIIVEKHLTVQNVNCDAELLLPNVSWYNILITGMLYTYLTVTCKWKKYFFYIFPIILSYLYQLQPIYQQHEYTPSLPTDSYMATTKDCFLLAAV